MCDLDRSFTHFQHIWIGFQRRTIEPWTTSAATGSKLTSKSRLTSSTECWNVGLISEYVPRFIVYADGYRARTHKNKKLEDFKGALEDIPCIQGIRHHIIHACGWARGWLNTDTLLLKYYASEIELVSSRAEGNWSSTWASDAPMFTSGSRQGMQRWDICTHRGAGVADLIWSDFKVSVNMCSRPRIL